MTANILEERARMLLRDAEEKAWKSLSQGKFSLFGYWAAKVVQFRELLEIAHYEPSPFRILVDEARNHTLPSKEKP